MKKIFSIFMAILIAATCMYSFSMPVFASDKTLINEVEINEWENYEKITSMNDNELLAQGYNESQIEEIRNFNYEDEIRSRASLSDEKLALYGYTEDEIIELRAAASLKEIPDAVIKSISTSTMTSTLRYVTNGSYTVSNSPMYYVDLQYNWSWSRIPFFTIVDMVAVGFKSSGNNEFIYTSVSGYNVRADLVAIESGYSNRTQVESWVWDTSKANSVSASFAIALKNNDDTITHFAYNGSGKLRLENRSNNVRLYVDAAYGHTTINVVPSYSIDFSGASVSLDFRIGMDEQHCTGYFLENFTIRDSEIYHGTVWGKNGTGGTA